MRSNLKLHSGKYGIQTLPYLRNASFELEIINVNDKRLIEKTGIIIRILHSNSQVIEVSTKKNDFIMAQVNSQQHNDQFKKLGSPWY